MVIFDEENIRIIQRGDKYYLETDVGYFGPQYEELEVSKEEAEKVVEDVMYYHKLFCDYHNKKWGLV